VGSPLFADAIAFAACQPARQRKAIGPFCEPYDGDRVEQEPANLVLETLRTIRADIARVDEKIDVKSTA
jgi:hypothetical protein